MESGGMQDRRTTDDGAAGRDEPLARTGERAFSPPTLRNSYVYLRAVLPDDYPYLYLVKTSGVKAP